MLAVAPTELSTDAERRLLAILTGLGSGTGNQGGLAVFVPVVDGALQRRQADALIFLPETLVVVRAVGIGRQGGELRATADRPWMVGAEILRLPGGGSTPVPQLAKAAEAVGASLRGGGLDPGSLPALIVLDGAITTVSRSGEEPVVATRMQSRDLLAALRRCMAQGSQGDTRIWTTADVRAALDVLDVLGIHGRVPSVEGLNGEGFLYSPYVLRRVGVGDPRAETTQFFAATTPPAEPSSLGGLFDGPPEPRRRSGAGIKVLAALTALALVALLVVVLVGDLVRQTDSPDTASEASEPSASDPVEPELPPEQEVDGATYTLAAPVQRDEDCAANAYGQVADFFLDRPCTGLQRALFTTEIDGRPAVVSLSIVTMPDHASAEEFQGLVDAPGTGNVSDLLRAGVRIDGGPAELAGPAFASAVSDQSVWIAEVGWFDPAADGAEPELDMAAIRALRLRLTN
ncbi:hypothetical protein BH20ACT5_BH20ACT5_19080 [soil metagenome]